MSHSLEFRTDNWMFYWRQGVSFPVLWIFSEFQLNLCQSQCQWQGVSPVVLCSLHFVRFTRVERGLSLAPQLSSCHTPHPSLIVFNQQFLQPHAFCTLFSLDTGHQQLSMALRWLLVTHLGHLERFGRWLWPLVGGEWLTAPSMLQFTNYLGISPLTVQRPGPAPCCRSLWGGARGTRRRSLSTWSPGTWSQRLWRLLWRLTEAQYPCSLSDTDIRAFSPLTTDHTALSLLSRQNHSGVGTHWNRSHRPLKTTS